MKSMKNQYSILHVRVVSWMYVDYWLVFQIYTKICLL